MKIFNFYIVFLMIMAVSVLLTITYMTNICHQQISTQSLQGKVTVAIQTVTVIPGKNCTCLNTTSVNFNIEVPTYTRTMVRKNKTEYGYKILWNKRKTTLKQCKVVPSTLIGRFNISRNVIPDEVFNAKVVQNVKYGGVYKPSDCYSDEKVAIIIPYRDREKHLAVLVNLLHTMLQQQNLQYGIYVVEMSLPVQFNRGLLANAGFLTANSIGNYTCYIIHDVDLIPVNDRNIYKCGASPRHLVASSTKFEDGLPYKDYVGGVLALTKTQYLKLNGFSNLYFGWGGEDDDIGKRISTCNMTIDRPAAHIGTYIALPHDKDSSNPPNPYRELLVSTTEYRKDQDGLNSMSYHRKAVEFRQLYTWILIACIESEVMKSLSQLRADSDLLLRKKQMRKNVKTIMA